MDSLSAKSILEGLDTETMGRSLVYLPQIGSTNKEARRLAEAGAPEGMLVITDYQTAGRGRLHRRWDAPPGSSLLMSLVFRPELAPHQVQRLTMVCGLAVTDAVESETGLRAALKWPNDIVLGRAKAGGILTETGLRGDSIDYAVVGIGLNVNLDPSQLAGDLLVPATSLSRVQGQPVARLPLLWALLRAVEKRYERLKAGELPHTEWMGSLVTVGQVVVVSSADEVVEGLAERADSDGALLVRLANGGLKKVVAGDVTLRTWGHDACA